MKEWEMVEFSRAHDKLMAVGNLPRCHKENFIRMKRWLFNEKFNIEEKLIEINEKIKEAEKSELVTEELPV